MGIIISSKALSDSRVLCKVLVSKNEFQDLKNHFKNIHLFAADLCADDTKLIQRGRDGATKYFLLPFNLRFRKQKAFGKISCQRIETDAKIFYMYVIDKRVL